MKRRNADTGKLRRPIKRIKITEGMYGNSMLYVKFILLWSSIALADYMLEFRFEFLWPLWLMMKGIYHCYYCKGLTFTVFFTCVALLSDMICYYFIPMQMLTYLAGVYVWVNSIWNTFESKGVCAQTVGMWLVVVYAEAVRAGVVGAALGSQPDEWPNKPWAASALGYPIVSLGVGVKQLLDEKLRLRTQRQVRAQNEFYFRLMREALPEGGLTSSTYSSDLLGELDGAEVKQNGSAKRRWKPETNGHCVRDKEHATLQTKLEHIEQYVDKARARDSSSSTHSQRSSNSTHTSQSSQPSPHARHNGSAKGAGHEHNNINHSKGGSKSSKYEKKEATTLKEERRRKKNRDIDKESTDSCKSKELTKEQDVDVEITKECVKIKECNNIHQEDKKRDEDIKREKEEERRREREDERRKEKERDRELKERKKEEEKERERERELLSARECSEEVSRLRVALSHSQRSEAECARQLASVLAADKQRRDKQQEIKQQLQHKMSTWRCGERAALERKLGEERRLRLAAEQLLKTRRAHGECENDWCKSRVSTAESEASALRTELQRARERLTHALRELTHSTDQVQALEAEKSVCSNNVGAQNGAAWSALQARAAHLERVLSSETRVKLDLLSALGDANRKMHIQENVINRQEKELEELKAQMLAVIPADFVSPRPGSVSKMRLSEGSPRPGSVSKMRLSEGSPLDPNASVYTPKQLCLDA